MVPNTLLTGRTSIGKTIFVTREVLAVIELAAAETASEKISQGSNPARSTSRYSVPVCLGPLLTWNTIPKRTPYRLINNTGLIRIQESPINDPVYARLKSSTVKIRMSSKFLKRPLKLSENDLFILVPVPIIKNLSQLLPTKARNQTQGNREENLNWVPESSMSDTRVLAEPIPIHEEAVPKFEA